MSAHPPHVVPVSWHVGLTEHQGDDDGPLEVRMTFARDDAGKQASRDWAVWLVTLSEITRATPEGK